MVKLDTTLIQSQAIFILYQIAFRGRMNSNSLEQHQSFTHIENRGGAIWPIGFMHENPVLTPKYLLPSQWVPGLAST